MMEPVTEVTFLGVKYDNPIVSSKLNYKIIDENSSKPLLMGEMVNHKNISVSVPINSALKSYGAKIAMDGKLCVRRSDLLEYLHLYSYRMRDFSPYFERISDVYWRFFEYGFGPYNRLIQIYVKQYYEEGVERHARESDSESTDDFTTHALLYVLSIGIVASLVVLVAEMLFFII